MKRLLVTGATGSLGSVLVPRAAEASWLVRSMSRRAQPADFEGEWAQADMLTGEGIEAAVRDVDTIIHCASNAAENALEVERDGTARLLAAARQSGVAHVVYVSIVGIDDSEAGYYRVKLAGEAAVAAGGVPYTIVRMTQFHVFINMMLGSYARERVMLIPAGWRFQPLDETEAAGVLLDLAAQPAAGRAADVGGPEVRTMEDMAAAWLASRGERKPILRLGVFGAHSDTWRSGVNLVPDRPFGEVRWEEWLRGKYGR